MAIVATATTTGGRLIVITDDWIVSPTGGTDCTTGAVTGTVGIVGAGASVDA